MTAIKICGITRREDADAAVALGACALGFVLWPGSPRSVALVDVGRIVSDLPPFVTPVGVFVSPSADDLARAVTDAGIRVAQIHGDMPVWNRRASVTILRAVHFGSGEDSGIEPAVPGSVPVLLDAWDPVQHGGTGRAVDWTRAAALARVRPVILAGGLTPANVAQAIQIVRPYAVDVASGIEAGPGVKDHERMRQFVEAVCRAADAGRSRPFAKEIP